MALEMDHQNDSTERVLKEQLLTEPLGFVPDHQNDSTERVLKDLHQPGLGIQLPRTIKTTRQSEY